MMASPVKLKSNIMELVCRTCLKINKNRFNIFEHSQHNKLVSEMLMECISLKVQKDDGFPTTICNVCLEKLISVLDFKEMAMLSFTKLHDFYMNKALKHEEIVGKCDSSDVLVEEELLSSESNDLFNDLIETSVYKCIAGLEIPHNENTHGNNNQEISKEKLTVENINSKENSSFKDKLSISNTSNNVNNSIELKQDISNGDDLEQLESVKSDEEMQLTQDICNSDDLEQLESIKSEEEMQINLKHKGYRKSGKSNMKLRVSSHYDSVDNSVDDSAFSNHYSSDSENDDGNSNAKQVIQEDERKDKNAFNWIEKHIEILNNPDCKKIISMGLSKKEKDRATVVCKECGKTVNFRYYVQVHAQTHIGNMPFKCERCDKSFPQRHILNQHIRAVHEKTIKLFCDVCGKGFASPSILLQHKAKHSDVKPFKCETCGKTFKLSGTLKKHYVIHKKDKQYMCELCGKSFLESNNLREHILSHTTDKNFNCTICEKSFTTKRGLDCHIKRHSGVRPYVCSYCGKTFTVGSVLKKHILIHTGAKPYTCKVCDRKFTQDSSLRYHMRIHTGEKPYSCELCCADFRYKHLLKNHMNKLHKTNDVKQESNS